MVSRRALMPALGLFLLPLMLAPFTGAYAQAITYRVDKEYVKIWINQDGTIDLQYDIKMTCLSGSIGGFYVGMPKGDFKIGSAKDMSGATLTAEDASSGDTYQVDVTLARRIGSGESAEFYLITNVAGMIYRDEQNPGNYGMQFTASWFEDAQVIDLRVLIVFPPGAETDLVKNTPDWSSPPVHDPSEDNRLTMYWERHSLGQGDKFTVGVSFPSSLMPSYNPEGGLSWSTILGIAGAGIFAVIVGLVVVQNVRRGTYVRPNMKIESLGVKAGLSAVEAAQLIGLPPQKVLMATLYGLLMKKAVGVEGIEPRIRIRALENHPELRYYEAEFVRAIKQDGMLDESVLAFMLMDLRDTVDNKLKGYCREDTVNYYREVVDKAWKQVEGAQTPELASNLYNENLLWLLLDDKCADKTQDKFGQMVFIPSPDWWWWWDYNMRYVPHPPSPTDMTSGRTSMPGADFANSIATALETGSSKIVSNMEELAKRILPPPPQEAKAREPVHHESNCVCACHSCACVCACVSCACACASGGAH